MLLLHTLPQAPQFDTLFDTLTSQPLLGFPSQSAKPGLHAVSAHVPPAQDSLAFARSQVCPQVPQLAREFVLTSQPLPDARSQLAKPALHAPSWQALAKHVAAALANVQALPQVLQLLGSRIVSTHLPPHFVCAGRHAASAAFAMSARSGCGGIPSRIARSAVS